MLTAYVTVFPEEWWEYLRHCHTVYIRLSSANTLCRCSAMGNYIPTKVARISSGTALRLCPLLTLPLFCCLPLTTPPRTLSSLSPPRAGSCRCSLFAWLGSSMLTNCSDSVVVRRVPKYYIYCCNNIHICLTGLLCM